MKNKTTLVFTLTLIVPGLGLSACHSTSDRGYTSPNSNQNMSPPSGSSTGGGGAGGGAGGGGAGGGAGGGGGGG